MNASLAITAIVIGFGIGWFFPGVVTSACAALGEFLKTLRNDVQLVFFSTPTSGPTPDLTNLMLRGQVADLKRRLLVCAACALLMGYFGREWGIKTEHDLHAGVHDCAVVDGPASVSGCVLHAVPEQVATTSATFDLCRKDWWRQDCSRGRWEPVASDAMIVFRQDANGGRLVVLGDP